MLANHLPTIAEDNWIVHFWSFQVSYVSIPGFATAVKKLAFGKQTKLLS